KSVLDFGSGAGIPGLVWAICVPSARVTSLEIRQKKVAFQKEAARTLGIQAEVIAGHFPEAVAGRKFDVIVTRAIRFSQGLWEEAEKLVSGKGILIRFGRPDDRIPGWESREICPGSAVLLKGLTEGLG